MNLLKSRIIQGTLLLTAAGFITRILGFFYRIFLADKLGAAVLGSYQLIFPIFAICSSIYGAGVQTAISQLIAAEQGKRSKLCSSDSPTHERSDNFPKYNRTKLSSYITAWMYPLLSACRQPHFLGIHKSRLDRCTFHYGTGVCTLFADYVHAVSLLWRGCLH